MNSFLKKLADRLQILDADIITADEIADWPEKIIKRLIKDGVLTEIQHSKGIICRECEENCFIEPDNRTNPETGESIGVFVCPRNPDIGQIKVDLERLRQWKINSEKLFELGYQVQIGFIVPWDENNTEYIPLQEAVNLANYDSITVKSLSRQLEDLEFPVRRMHNGRRCNVHLADFRKWLQYAQYGKITDKAIEKYLERTEERKKVAKKRK